MTATLFTYMKQVQRLLRDTRQELIDPGDIIDCVNRARREVAMRSQCVRVLPPISGSVVSIPLPPALTNGQYWTSPAVTITPPDFPSGYGAHPSGAQATAIATAISGSTTLQEIAVTFGGSGYFQPIVTVSDPTGVSVNVTPKVSPINATAQGQEVYPFSAVDLSTFSGVDSIIAVKSVSIIYANYRYSLPQYGFSVYQARVRQYPFQYQYVPTFCSQFGQGANGSLYMYPLPTQAYQMEWDCFCLPSDLTSDESPEVIPDPWTDVVPHYAIYLAYLELQSFNNAKVHLDLFTDFMHRYRAAVSPGRAVNPYGRW